MKRLKLFREILSLVISFIICYYSITIGMFFSIGIALNGCSVVVYSLTTIKVLDFVSLFVVGVGVLGSIISFVVFSKSINALIVSIKNIDKIIKE